MADFVGTLVSAQVDTELTKRDGGTYRGAQIVYNSNGEIKQKNIHNKVVSSKPQLASKIKSLEGKSGVEIALRMNKNERGFWDVEDILSAEEAAANPQRGSGRGQGGGGGGGFASSARSTQDTARIARATAIEAASKLAKDGKEALKLAQDFAAFILEPVSLDTTGEKVSTDTKTEGSKDDDHPF